MTAPIQYRMYLDTARDNTFARSIDEITPYLIEQIQFNHGMADSYDEVSAPARMTFKVSNRGGEFDRENEGNELIVNGGFTSWSGGLPVGWLASGTTSCITECGGEFLDGGTGAVNFYNSGLATGASLRQNILVPGRTYVMRFDITDSANDLTSPGKNSITIYKPLAFSGGTSPNIFYRLIPGKYEWFFVANAITCGMGLQISSPHNISFTNFSVKSVPTYRMMNKGMLVKLTATRNGTETPLFVGRIADMDFALGTSQEPTCTITVEDAMLELLDAEYQPPLLENPTADVAFDDIFDAPVVVWPYTKNYWLLGVQGSSELGINTYLYDHDMTDFETGITEFAFLGDLADKGQGVSAQGYIRDIMTAEGGGRFYWDVRTQKFVFHGRHHDVFNTTVTTALTKSDLDAVQYNYGEEIVNQLTVNYSFREVGAAGSVLWSYTNLPLTMKPRTTKTLTARYIDATDETIRVGGKDFVQISPGVDFTASNEMGQDVSSLITVTVDFKATGAKIYLNNPTADTVILATLQLRGTPLRQKDETTESLDGASKAANELRPKTLDARFIDDPDLAQNFTDYTVARFKDPLTRLKNITFNSLRNETMLEASINRVIGDRITVTLADENHDADYFIVGEQRMIAIGGDMPADVTWILKPASRDLFWTLGVVGQSELGQTTILGF